jgi:DNA primase
MTISEQVLMNELNKKLRDRFQKNASLPETESILPPRDQIYSDPVPPLDPNSSEYQEREIIRMMLLYGQDIIRINKSPGDPEEIPVLIADFVVHEILSDGLGFENILYKKIFQDYIKGNENDALPGRDWFLSHPDPEISQTAVNLVFSPYELSQNWLKNNIQVETEESRLKMNIERVILSFKSKKIDKMIADVQQKLVKATSEEEQKSLLKAWQELKEQSIRINTQGLGRIVIH